MPVVLEVVAMSGSPPSNASQAIEALTSAKVEAASLVRYGPRGASIYFVVKNQEKIGPFQAALSAVYQNISMRLAPVEILHDCLGGRPSWFKIKSQKSGYLYIIPVPYPIQPTELALKLALYNFRVCVYTHISGSQAILVISPTKSSDALRVTVSALCGSEARPLSGPRLYLAVRKFLNLKPIGPCHPNPNYFFPTLPTITERILPITPFLHGTVSSKDVFGEIKIGNIANTSIPVGINLNELPLGLAIFGMPGTGKTRLALSLARQVQKLGCKVLVLDRHGEYAGKLTARVMGVDDLRLDFLNPDGEPIDSHAKRLSELLSMAWPGEFGPLMSHIFRKSLIALASEGRVTLKSLIQYVRMQAEHSPSMKERDKAFSLVSRLSELSTGGLGLVFSGHGRPIEDLFEDDSIIDLSELESDRDRNILSWLLLKRLYEYRRLIKPSPPHITIIEEAHHVTPPGPTIVDYMLMELRKFNESLWIIDQRPSELSKTVLSLTSTIVSFRLRGYADQEALSITMGLDGASFGSLTKGVGIVLTPRILNPVQISVRRVAGPVRLV